MWTMHFLGHLWSLIRSSVCLCHRCWYKVWVTSNPHSSLIPAMKIQASQLTKVGQSRASLLYLARKGRARIAIHSWASKKISPNRSSRRNWTYAWYCQSTVPLARCRPTMVRDSRSFSEEVGPSDWHWHFCHRLRIEDSRSLADAVSTVLSIVESGQQYWHSYHRYPGLIALVGKIGQVGVNGILTCVRFLGRLQCSSHSDGRGGLVGESWRNISIWKMSTGCNGLDLQYVIEYWFNWYIVEFELHLRD